MDADHSSMVVESTPKCILYVFDSLRWDHLSCYGYEHNSTPAFDRLADDGVRFERAFSQGIWTLPSAATIFSGLYPETHGSRQYDQPLGGGLPHFVEGLAETRIETACFSTTLGVSPERGFEREFDEFHHLGQDGNALRPDVMDRLNERLLPWIEAHADDPFLVVVWAMGTHHPFVTPDDVEEPGLSVSPDPSVQGSVGWLKRQPPETVGRVKELYDGAVSYSDRAFGELIDTLQRHGIYDRTTVVATADHGEIFDEHSRLEHAHPAIRWLLSGLVTTDGLRARLPFASRAWIGHQAIFPYDELIHVPLVLKPDDRAIDRESFGGQVELVDVYPTVRDALGVETDPRTQGTSLYTLLEGGTGKEHVYSASEVQEGNLVFRSIRSDDHKLCTQELLGIRRGSDPWLRSLELLGSHLLNRTSVLLEIRDGGATERRIRDPQRRRRLREQLREHVVRRTDERAAFEAGSSRIDIDDETRRQLSDLGYN